MDRSAERALLVAAARAFLKEEPPAEALTAVRARSLDWDWILARAGEERLAPLLYTVLRPLPVPAPALEVLRRAWVAFRRQHLLGVEQLAGVLAAFERERLPVMLLKGPALAVTLYRDAGLRPFTDLDLFIRQAAVPRALRLLSALGYRHLAGGRSLPYETTYAAAACFVRGEEKAEAFPLDVHWRLLDYRSGPRAAAANLEEVWDRAVKIEGWPALGLSFEDLLIYLAVHLAVHHALAGLGWQLDLALLIRRHGDTLDWGSVGERARRWGVAGALYFALREIQERFGVDVPSSLLVCVEPRGPRRAVLDWVRRRRDAPRERLDYLVPLLLMDRGSDLLRLLAAGAVPSAAWVRVRYARASALGAYLAHYGRIGRVFWRTLRAALGSGLNI